jgi:hypothetical protein
VTDLEGAKAIIIHLTGQPEDPTPMLLKMVADIRSDPASDGAINTTALEDLRQCGVMIRTWIPDVYPANILGQVSFARAVMESVGDTIDRVLVDAGMAVPVALPAVAEPSAAG